MKPPDGDDRSRRPMSFAATLIPMSKVQAAWVQVQQPGRPSVEARAVLDTFAAHELPTLTGSLKQMQRGRVELSPEVLVFGDHDVMRAAFKRLSVDGPWLADYPTGVEPFLRRTMRATTLGQARAQVEESGRASFLKPRDARKRFTGFVYSPGNDGFAFAGASRSLPVWCSDPLEFGDEFRAYVCEGTVIGTTVYKGTKPDAVEGVEQFATKVVRALEQADSAVAGYSIDIGRTADGLAVVECNDGFALGLYDGVDAERYTDLLCARWSELMRTRSA